MYFFLSFFPFLFYFTFQFIFPKYFLRRSVFFYQFYARRSKELTLFIEAIVSCKNFLYKHNIIHSIWFVFTAIHWWIQKMMRFQELEEISFCIVFCSPSQLDFIIFNFFFSFLPKIEMFWGYFFGFFIEGIKIKHKKKLEISHHVLLYEQSIFWSGYGCK